ncbi:homeobox protein EMX2 [Lates japonicus]|uniref:Homeobox protein EMX2 n=1 Tax=Lates japonicus TaxID=270547 RepID=A0AAD3MLU8_LATJO|nr:homeobox protein EMX2 [Lates japonicus]
MCGGSSDESVCVARSESPPPRPSLPIDAPFKRLPPSTLRRAAAAATNHYAITAFQRKLFMGLQLIRLMNQQICLHEPGEENDHIHGLKAVSLSSAKLVLVHLVALPHAWAAHPPFLLAQSAPSFASQQRDPSTFYPCYYTDIGTWVTDFKVMNESEPLHARWPESPKNPDSHRNSCGLEHAFEKTIDVVGAERKQPAHSL